MVSPLLGIPFKELFALSLRQTDCALSDHANLLLDSYKSFVYPPSSIYLKRKSGYDQMDLLMLS